MCKASINEFNLTMSFKISDKQLLKKYDQRSNMEKNWKSTENKIWQQTCLWWWWEIHKNKNKNIRW